MTDPSVPRFLTAVPALPLSDERRAVAFLERALGFVEPEHEGKGLGILRRDDVELHCAGREADNNLIGRYERVVG